MPDEEPRWAALAHALEHVMRDDPDLAEGVLVGFVCVSEWMAPDGERWLALRWGDGTGEPDAVKAWTRDGWLLAGDSHRWSDGALAPRDPDAGDDD